MAKWNSGGRPGKPSYALNLVLLSSYADSTKKVSDVLKLFEDGDMNRFCQEDVSVMGHPLLDSQLAGNFRGPSSCFPTSKYPIVECYWSRCFRTRGEILVTQEMAQVTIHPPLVPGSRASIVWLPVPQSSASLSCRLPSVMLNSYHRSLATWDLSIS